MVQKQTSDPLKGFPATPAELAAGRLGLTSAFAGARAAAWPPASGRCERARLDVKRAQADLETLLGGTPVARAEAIHLAKLNVQLAQDRLAHLLAPADPAEAERRQSGGQEGRGRSGDAAAAPGSSVGRADHRSTAGGDRHAAEARGRTGVRHAGRDRCSPARARPGARRSRGVAPASPCSSVRRGRRCQAGGRRRALQAREAPRAPERRRREVCAPRARPSPVRPANTSGRTKPGCAGRRPPGGPGAFRRGSRSLLGPPLRSDEALARLEVRQGSRQTSRCFARAASPLRGSTSPSPGSRSPLPGSGSPSPPSTGDS